MTRQQVGALVPQAHDYAFSLPYEKTQYLYGTNEWKEDGCRSTLNFFFSSKGGLRAINLSVDSGSTADKQACASRWVMDLNNRYGSAVYMSHRTFSNGLMLSVLKVWRSRNCDVSLNQEFIPSSGPLTSIEIIYTTPGFFSLPHGSAGAAG